ncbi:hypothetical protein [Pseudonocardia sp. McavD-2-B]|uniref:hypothetical protein n=1 Tax=Pseudonocardia sp. McavD-2-B TaxID=2954499 RepID=UPI0020977C82|nr:hypothetical protein [Pseudonocardia sp. McavD-2-B]MCO7193203.1 hypothetical protein [Pseudonocardia sp. McavD-2-B]
MLTGAVGLATSALVAGCADGVAPVSVSRPTRPRRDPAHWTSRFDGEAAALDADSEPLSRSPDSWDFYRLAYALDAFTSMYEASGAEQWADVALRYAENMIATSVPSTDLGTSGAGDTYRGWVSQQPDVAGQQVPLYESYCWRYVARLLAVLQERAAAGGAGALRFGARHRRVLTFCEDDILLKWYRRGPAETVYRSRTHMTAHWAYLALHLGTTTSRREVRDLCADIVRRVDDGGMAGYPSSLRQQLRLAGGSPASYVWSPVWGYVAEPQDVAHGNADVAYIAAAHLRGGRWSAAEVATMTATLLGPVLGADGHYPEYVDGSGQGTGWIADGFVTLGRFDPACQAALEEHRVQNGQFLAAMAVNAAWLARPGGGS